MTRKKPRRRLYVDGNVQGGLVLRVAFYWCVCLLTVSLMVLCWAVMTGPRAPALETFGTALKNHLPAMIASLLLLPMVLIDCNRFSNRFVGPIMRFRNAMRCVAKGEQVGPIKFRDKDYWHDIADSFNLVLASPPSPGREASVAAAAEAARDESRQPEAEPEREPAGAC